MKIIDGLLGATDLVRSAKSRTAIDGPMERPSTSIEARLASVVVSALKEAFDRDHERMELERQQIELQRQRMEEDRLRAERAMRLELLRQVGDREIGRLRLIGGTAMVSWLGTLLLATRLTSGGAFPRVALGLGWALLLAAIAASLTAQGAVARALGRADDRLPSSDVAATPGGSAAPWLIVAGLGLIAIGVLFV
jgi:hypothetical protein